MTRLLKIAAMCVGVGLGACDLALAPYNSAYTLTRYEAEPVPSRDYAGERIVGGTVWLKRDGRFVDVLDRTYTDTLGRIVAVRDSFDGTWTHQGDSVMFRAIGFSYVGHYVDRTLTLRWADASRVMRTFEYQGGM